MQHISMYIYTILQNTLSYPIRILCVRTVNIMMTSRTLPEEVVMLAEEW